MFPGTTRPKTSRGIGVTTVTFFMMMTFPAPCVGFLERLLEFFHVGNYLGVGLLGVLVVPGTISFDG